MLELALGGQSGVAVTRPHGNHQDVGSNPATARNEKQALGVPLQKVAQRSNRISKKDRRCKAELELWQKNENKQTKKKIWP